MIVRLEVETAGSQALMMLGASLGVGMEAMTAAVLTRHTAASMIVL